MPVKEIDLQTELKEAAISYGGYSYKMSNRFLVGVLDLYVQLPSRPTVILEVKYVNKMPRDGMVKVGLSSHQERSIKSMCAAGGNAGWVVLTRRGPGEYAWHAGRLPPVGKVHATPFGCASVKLRGQSWPIADIIKEIVGC